MVSRHLFFYICINNSRCKQKFKKIPEQAFVDIIKKKTCAKFQEKVLNSMVVRAQQSFQFFRQKTWFLGNNRPWP